MVANGSRLTIRVFVTFSYC